MISTINHIASLLSECITTKDLKLGTTLHSHLIKTALYMNTFIANRLIDVYVKCNSINSAQKVFEDSPIKTTRSWNTIIYGLSKVRLFDDACKLFDEMPNPNIVSYNSMISSLTHRGLYEKAIELFLKMQKKYGGIYMDEITFVSVVNTCGRIGSLNMLRQLHGAAVLIGLELNNIVCNALIDTYAKCGEVDSSYSVFSRMIDRDVVSWTSMVVAYVRASRLDDAFQIFNEMPTRNVISWTSMIAGFAEKGHGEKALEFFKQMQEEEINPNSHTFVAVLSACADLALNQSGKQIHGHIIRNDNMFSLFNINIWNALIDMYCKCGDVRSAKILFDMMPEKDTISWNSLITGFAQHGNAEESLLIFHRMITENVQPNHITFLGVLSACSHTGLVSEGFHLLDSMESDYNISPRPDHYAIMIDLLGRKNQLKEAIELIEKSPYGSMHVGIWGALLGACRVHGNLDIAQRAAEALFKLEPGNAARYVMLSNIYAAAGRWEDACRLRKMMEERSLIKDVACSWIEVRNKRHEFVAKEKRNQHIEGVYEVLDKLLDHMDDARYTPSASSLPLPNTDDGIDCFC